MAHTDIHHMTLSGGASCLDLVNTGLETGGIPVERLHNYEDILLLTQRLGLIPPAELQSLHKRAQKEPIIALQSWKNAIDIRKVLTNLFSAIADKDLPALPKRDLRQFNTWRAKALAGQGFKLHNGALILDWTHPGAALMQPIWAFLLSANKLLQKDDLHYIKRCAGCDWIFYDQSKSHRRKWCDMQTCGSSAKAKRYYEKKKADRSA